MFGGKFDSARCETQCRMALGRIKIVRNKRTLQMAAHRKEIAELLRQGKQDYARIRVEAVIRETLTLQAFDLLELYLELLAVRAPLVATTKEIPRDMVEALSSVLYAASRVPDLPELQTLQKMFVQKYGKEYVDQASNDGTCHRWNVNEQLRRYVTIEAPDPSLKLQTLSEIAQEAQVEWDADRARREMLPGETGGTSGGGYGGGYGGSGDGAAVAAAVPTPAAVAPAPTGSFTSAQQAAEAAAKAAADAAFAAEYARRLAGSGPAGGGGGGAAIVGGLAPVAPPPAAGWGAGPSGPGNAAGGGGGYRVPSAEEIQRAYDSAQGPPAKVQDGYLDPSVAPAAAPPADPAPAAPPAAGGGDSGASDLPAAPRPGGPATTNNSAAISSLDREMDEIQRRLDALKRQP